MARIVVDPPELDTLAAGCAADGGEIMSLSTTLGTHVVTAGLSLLAAYGIGISQVVDQLVHLAGGPDGVLRVAHRFGDDAQGVTRSRDEFLRADGQPVPTSPDKWLWKVIDRLQSIDGALGDADRFAMSLIAAEHQIVAGTGLAMSAAGALSRFLLGDAVGEGIEAAGGGLKAGLRAFRSVDGELDEITKELGAYGSDVRQATAEVAAEAKGEIAAEAAAEAEIGEEAASKAALLGKFGMAGKVFGGVSVGLSALQVYGDLEHPRDGKVDYADVGFDTLSTVGGLVTFVNPGAGLVISGVAVGGKYLYDHREAIGYGIETAWDTGTRYAEHRVAGVVQGAEGVVTGGAQAAHGVADVLTGNPVKGGEEVVSGATKSVKGALKALNPF
ncbi:hypothetical protein [Pseudofrankia inefficax]|uniref:Uncharacterized protein n=1 Tax=Pseudofrankia inefficax (strain DSM 45817 / CECT 9037 / DDB 130130 / EuI1c) TaxID=298654 RepID=E3IYY3_PSEI1|nr:hypothetical protein [Pseudofrankia inefficax]ADP80266.1 hypothetical protein FraEuI1c_2227 [Pseudofrankia inefficax]